MEKRSHQRRRARPSRALAPAGPLLLRLHPGHPVRRLAQMGCRPQRRGAVGRRPRPLGPPERRACTGWLQEGRRVGRCPVPLGLPRERWGSGGRLREGRRVGRCPVPSGLPRLGQACRGCPQGRLEAGLLHRVRAQLHPQRLRPAHRRLLVRRLAAKRLHHQAEELRRHPRRRQECRLPRWPRVGQRPLPGHWDRGRAGRLVLQLPVPGGLAPRLPASEGLAPRLPASENLAPRLPASEGLAPWLRAFEGLLQSQQPARRGPERHPVPTGLGLRVRQLPQRRTQPLPLAPRPVQQPPRAWALHRARLAQCSVCARPVTMVRSDVARRLAGPVRRLRAAPPPASSP